MTSIATVLSLLGFANLLLVRAMTNRARQLHDASWDNRLGRFTLDLSRDGNPLRFIGFFANPYKQFQDSRLNAMVMIERVLFVVLSIGLCWYLYLLMRH